MDNQEVSQVVQSQESPAPVSEAPPAALDVAASNPEKVARSVAPTAEQAAQVAATAFAPNFKFQAMGKEHEIPEFLRGAIKDKQSQEFMQDLFSKAHGLMPIKERLQETRGQLQEVTKNFQSVMAPIEEARTAYRKNDMDTVFDILKIEPDKVLQWAVQKVQLSQLPPEQQRAYEEKRVAEKRAFELEKQSQSSNSEIQQQQTQMVSQMLDLVLERPDFQNVAQFYDGKRGQAGSFRALVVQMGRSEFALSGKFIPPLEAAKKAVELIGGMPEAQAAPAAQAPVPEATPAATEKKTLPNLAKAGARSNTSPGKKAMKSIDDLKRKYDQISAGQ